MERNRKKGKRAAPVLIHRTGEQQRSAEINPLSLLNFTVLGTLHNGHITPTTSRAIEEADILCIEGRDDTGAWGKSILGKMEEVRQKTSRRIRLIYPDVQMSITGKSFVDKLKELPATLAGVVKKLRDSETDEQFDQSITESMTVIIEAEQDQMDREQDSAKRIVQSVRGLAREIQNLRLAKAQAARRGNTVLEEPGNSRINVLVLFGTMHGETLAAALKEAVVHEYRKDLGVGANSIPVTSRKDDAIDSWRLLGKDLYILLIEEVKRRMLSGEIAVKDGPDGKIVNGFPKESLIRFIFFFPISSMAHEEGLGEDFINWAMQLPAEEMERRLREKDFDNLVDESV